jgi:hypothetical protein
MNIENPELRLAEEFVQHTNSTIFLTGKAGTGKTTFLHAIKNKTAKRLVVTAPTGVAAINAGGVTLHSFFQLPFGPFVPGNQPQPGRHRIRREKRNLIISLDLLVIDEISMVRADLLDGVDSVLRRLRRNDQPFGGVQLLMIGDMHQLPPVVKSDEWQILAQHYDSPYFFCSTALGRIAMVPIELKHIYRQSDQRFIELLNRVRDNNLDPPAVELLNSRHDPNFSAPDGQGYITLCTHNKRAEAINEAKLKELPGSSRRFDARQDGDFPEQAYPTAATLELKKGAQVMFIRNDMTPDKRYFNGKIGEIAGMSKDTIQIRCPGESQLITVEKTTWENIEYTVDPKTAEISHRVIGTFRQYPIKLAWAITIHKSQGLTFDKAVIDAQAAFAHGQVYVALSRCRTLEGIVLSSPLCLPSLKSDPAVRCFVEQVTGAGPSAQTLADAKRDYQQKLLLACFTFDRLRRLLGRLTWLLRVNEAVIQVLGGGNIVEVRRRAEAEICTIGDNFKRQLQRMFGGCDQPAADPAILERLEKAADYFQDKFDTILTTCLKNFEMETDNKEIRKQTNDAVKQLKTETAAKIAGILSCRGGFAPEVYLRAVSAAQITAEKPRQKPKTVVYTEADVGHPEMFETLRQWRQQTAAEQGLAHFQVLHQKTLVQIAVQLPDSMKALKKIKGIGPRLAEKYGQALIDMVTAYRREHGIDDVSLPETAVTAPQQKTEAKPAVKEDTRKVSFEWFNKGMTTAQIAARRGLATSTIEGHLASFVSKGKLAISQVIADERRLAIEETITQMPDASLKGLKTTLGKDYSYGEIQLVMAHLKHTVKA